MRALRKPKVLLLCDAPEHFSSVVRGGAPLHALREAGAIELAIESWPGPMLDDADPVAVEEAVARVKEQTEKDGGLHFPKQLVRHVAYADVIVIPQTASTAWYGLIPFFQSKGKVVVLDADDDTFSVSPASPSYRIRGTKECDLKGKDGKIIGAWRDYSRYPDCKQEDLAKQDPPIYLMNLEFNRRNMERVEKGLRGCDAITVPTERSRTRFLDYNPNVYVLPNSVDMTTYVPRRHPGRPGFRVLWFGGNSHEGDLGAAARGFARFQKEHQDVLLVVCGQVLATLARHVPPERIEAWEWTCPEAHPWRLQSLGADLTFAAIEEGVKFNDCKSPLKWTETGALGIPCICTNAPPYSDAVRHDEDGWLVRNTPEEWYAAFTRFYGDAALRKRIGDGARARMEQDFDVHSNATGWFDVYDLLINARHPVLDGSGERVG